MDLLSLRQTPAHVVGFSWGGLVAAAERPEIVKSLTIIEAPLYSIARGDPEVDRLEKISAEFLTRGLDADREVLRAFLALSGVSRTLPDPLPVEVRDFIEGAHGARLAGEATPALGIIVAAGIPALVVSGGHAAGIERICDCLADRVGAERSILPGRGHAVPRADGFNELVEAFWTRADRRERHHAAVPRRG